MGATLGMSMPVVFQPSVGGGSAIHRQQFADTTLRTHTGDALWVDSGTTFTLTVPVNALVLIVYFSCEMKTSNVSHSAMANVQLSGANLGTVWGKVALMHHFGNEPLNTRHTLSYFDSVAEWDLILTRKNAFLDYSTFLPAIQILDETTTVKVRIRIENAASTVSIKNVRIDFIYVETYTED